MERNDDHEKKKTRFELLQNWQTELKKVEFLKGKTEEVLKKLKIPRVNFAFLDAEHDFKSVFLEYKF